MEIRQLTIDEFDPSTDLAEYAFGYQLTAEERERRRARFKPEQVWGAWEGEELQARLILLPLELYIQGTRIPMGGIAGVCTWPEHRRKGLVNQLLQQALKVMKEQGQMLSCLHPFLIPFYRRFGWEVYTEYKKYTIPVPALGVTGKFQASGFVKRGVRDLSTLAPLYERFAERYNGTLVRSREWWEHSVFDDELLTAVYYSEAGKPEGYLLYKISGEELTVDEFVYGNETARRGLWEFLNQHDSKVARVVVDHVPSDDLLPYLLNDPRCKQETRPYFMARIVDVQAFVERYKFEPSPGTDRETAVRLSLQDEFAAWNDGEWELRIGPDGQGRVTPATAKPESEETGTEADFAAAAKGVVADSAEEGSAAAVVSCDIQSLAAMLLGYKRPRELYLAERIGGSQAGIALLERVIPQRGTALMDFF
ncbi:acetyltransferase [Paenibacillus yonginensis]|uniref:Acetyltransferase n=1 Tax=Paenibacillus yonginensis TaxID=1462996 RepID=A0A1B1N360_9BACL|nr:GNAT family N-acetyltransferase [Paenibacillus yonginensis]ANS75871.1 acetyltransferase [Paenibacillus yonginensis]